MILVLCQKKWCKFGLVSNGLCMFVRWPVGTCFLWAVVGSLSFCGKFFCQEFLFCYFERGPKTYRAFVYLEDDGFDGFGVFGVSRKWLEDEDGFIARGRDCWWLLYGFMLQETLKFQASTLITGSWNHPPQTLGWRFHEGTHEFLIEQNFLIFGIPLGDLFQALDWWHHWLVDPKKRRRSESKATWCFR